MASLAVTEMFNEQINSGKVEVLASSLTIFSHAKTPPFTPDEHYKMSEEMRLRYRYIDLRRPQMSQRLQFRANVVKIMRRILRKIVHHDTKNLGDISTLANPNVVDQLIQEVP